MQWSPDDIEIGFWVQGTPYVLPPAGGRIYTNIQIGLAGKRCSKEVSKYFTEKKIRKRTPEEQVERVNGRLFYVHGVDPMNMKNVIVGKNTQPTKLAKLISSVGGLHGIDISTLVCGLNLDLESLITPSPSDGCTLYGRKIAKSLIKVAATRIFADPTQAFMEPIANSIDAYFPKRRIGKFGMGFFSMLYWVMIPGSRLEIENYSPGECYLAIITYDPSAQTFRLDVQIALESKVPSTGAAIKLYLPDTPQTELAIGSAGKMVTKFVFVQGINLLVPQLFLTSITQDHKPVFFKVHDLQKYSVLCFEDRATGIPLHILFSGLLVASVSTKMIVGGEQREADASLPSRVVSIKGSALTITIGDVIIGRWSTGEGSLEAILSLPSTTRLPVGRDDFILDSETRKKITSDVINIIAPGFENLSDLERLVRAYSAFTSSEENARVLDSALDQYRKGLKIIVPGAYLSIYKTIDPKVVGSNFFSTFEVESWLDKHAKIEKEIWTGVKVIFYSSVGEVKDVTFAGTNTYLFVPNEFRKHNNWQSRLEASFQERRLWAVGESSVKSLIKKLGKDDLAKATKDQLALVVAVIGAVKSKEAYYEMPLDWEPGLRGVVDKIYRIYGNNQRFYIMMTAVLSRLSKMIPKYEYGNAKEELFIFFPSIEMKTKIAELYSDMFIWICKNASSKELSVFPWLVIFDKLSLWNVNTPETNDFMEYYLTLSVMSGLVQIVVRNLAFPIRSKNLPKLEISKSMVTSILEDIKPIKRSLVSHPRRLIEYWKNRSAYTGAILLSKPANIYSGLEALDRLVIKYRLLIKTEKTLTLSKIPKPIYQKPLAEFQVSDLISTLFRIPYSGLNFYSLITKGPEPKLQILSIAINEATTKSYVDAVITETFQNSVDAIRGTSTPGGIDFKVVPSKKMVLYEIRDPVGMNEDQFFHLGIPFLSTKTPSELQTGEMGTGFFNIYRRASMVTVETYDGKGTPLVMFDTPERDNDHRVTNINRRIFTNAKLPKGTTIRAYIPTSSRDESMSIASSMISYIESVIISSPLEIPITLNSEVLPPFSGKLYFDAEYYQVFGGGQGPGVMCTKGIPLGHLSSFISAKEDANDFYGITVNLKHQGYTPVHSRSRVNISPNIAKFIPDARFINFLAEQITGRARYISHTLSSAPVSQVLPSSGYGWSNYQPGASGYVMGFYNFNGLGSNVSDLIIKIGHAYDDDIIGTKIASDIKTLSGEAGEILSEGLKGQTKVLRNSVESAIAVWFYKKNKGEANIPQTVTSAENISEDQKAPPELVNWIKAYGQVYSIFLIKYFSTKLNLKIEVVINPKSTVLGFFSPVQNTINIFIQAYQIEDGLKDYRTFLDSEDPNKAALNLKSKFFTNMFFDADSTMPHELEHYRRGDEHSDTGVHSPVEETIFGKKELYTFPQATMLLRSKFIEEGLWEKVQEILRK